MHTLLAQRLSALLLCVCLWTNLRSVGLCKAQCCPNQGRVNSPCAASLLSLVSRSHTLDIADKSRHSRTLLCQVTAASPPPTRLLGPALTTRACSIVRMQTILQGQTSLPSLEGPHCPRRLLGF